MGVAVEDERPGVERLRYDGRGVVGRKEVVGQKEVGVGAQRGCCCMAEE